VEEEPSDTIAAICPEVEADWMANISFDVRIDEELGFRGLRLAMSEYAENLRKRKKYFELISREVRWHPNGFEFGDIRCRHNDGVTQLLDREVLVPLRDRRTLFILASTAEAVASKYEPIFDHVLGSLHCTERQEAKTSRMGMVAVIVAQGKAWPTWLMFRSLGEIDRVVDVTQAPGLSNSDKQELYDAAWQCVDREFLLTEHPLVDLKAVVSGFKAEAASGWFEGYKPGTQQEPILIYSASPALGGLVSQALSRAADE
jgi:hypothetical protein